MAPLLSDGHLWADGMLVKARASMESFRPKDEDALPDDDSGPDEPPATRAPDQPQPGIGIAPMTRPARQDRNAEVGFRGEKRLNAAHTSTTGPEARLCRKPSGAGAMLCFRGHALRETRSGLVVQAGLMQANGHAGRRAALDMIHPHAPGSTRRLTLGADRGYDSADFVADLRQACIAPHGARKVRHSAVAGRTTRHAGYALSRTRRKTIEEPFGWARTVGGMAQTVCRGVERVRARLTLTMAGCNLARLPRLPRLLAA